MSLFASPEKHAANPPETWTVHKAADRVWYLRDAEGATLDRFTTRREAEAAKISGPAARLYEKESRWYAGLPVAGWRPYAETVAR